MGRSLASEPLTTENLTPMTAVDDGEDESRTGRGRQPLRRRPAIGLVGGVCAGLAEYLEVEPIVVRVCFVIMVIAGGFGLALYPLAWALIPVAEAPGGQRVRLPWAMRLSGWAEAAALALLVFAAIFVLRRQGLWLGNEFVLPIVLACSGLALILRQAGSAEWVPGDALSGAGAADAERERRWRHWPGVAIGAMLIVTAAFLFMRQQGILVTTGRAMLELVVIVVALGLVVSPGVVRLARSLASERSQRIRSQARADVAAHLHDSVLQTLALIQRRADDPHEVAQLARSQERELRHWLFEPDGRLASDTLATALQQAAADVEGIHGVRVEAVTVGDCPLDEHLEATVAAAREALTNAAKFAGGERIDVYAEVDAERVQVFVRDRGAGFDPDAIPSDRRGVRKSIIERMSRHGGWAKVNAEPGRGTEIELTMGRS